MSKFVEFDAIIPASVFNHVEVESIVTMFESFNVSFVVVGYSSDFSLQCLVTCHSPESASSSLTFLRSLRRLVLASAFSPLDRKRCKSWTFGDFRYLAF